MKIQPDAYVRSKLSPGKVASAPPTLLTASTYPCRETLQMYPKFPEGLKKIFVPSEVMPLVCPLVMQIDPLAIELGFETVTIEPPLPINRAERGISHFA